MESWKKEQFSTKVFFKTQMAGETREGLRAWDFDECGEEGMAKY